MHPVGAKEQSDATLICQIHERIMNNVHISPTLMMLRASFSKHFCDVKFCNQELRAK